MATDPAISLAAQHGARMPWSFSLYARSPAGPLLTGIALAIILFLAAVSIELITGRPQALLRGEPAVEVGCFYLRGDYRIAVVGILLLMYAATARYVLSRWTRQAGDLLAHTELVDVDTLAANRLWGAIPGLLGIAICVGFAVDIAERDVEWTQSYWIFPHMFTWGWCIPFGWVGGRLIFALLGNAVLVSRLARKVEVTDLEDIRPFEAAARHGMRTALLSIMLLGLISVHFVDPGLGVGAVVFVVAMFVVGSVMSALPAMGVVKVFYDRRDEELRMLRKEIEIEEQQLRDKDPDYEPGRIGDIVALEKRLQDWSLSIFRFSTFARLLVYAVIGFMSWLAAEAVSVYVESLFGF